MALNARQQRFVEEIAKGNSATQAYIAAGFSAKTADVCASRLLGNAKVQSALAEIRAKASADTGITVAKVLERYWDLATVDANDLVEHRIGCCRHCWGQGFNYQFTAREMAKARERWSRKKERKEGETFDTLGGVGFHAHRDPNPDCPECFGDGVGDVKIKDSRKLTGGARLAYAGVAVTKDGFKLNLEDRAAALGNVAKHLGMFVERHEHTGKDGGPIQVWQFGAHVVKF